MKRIPIRVAKQFLEQHNLQQVLILARDKDGYDHVVTYGATKADCKEIGLGGDRLKAWMKWPPSTMSKYSKKPPKPYIIHPYHGDNPFMRKSAFTIRRPGAKRASAVRKNEDAAIDYVRTHGGTSVTIHNKDGTVKSSKVFD